VRARATIALVAAATFAGMAAACGGGGEGDGETWKTYESPAGFTIEYPPSWKVVSYDAPGTQKGNVKILNEKRQQQTAPEGGDSGEAWVEIVPEAFPHAPLDKELSSCGFSVGGGSSEVSDSTLGGRDAVLCVGSGPGVYSDLELRLLSYSIEQPPGKTLAINAYAVDVGPEEFELLKRVLATVSFED